LVALVVVVVVKTPPLGQVAVAVAVARVGSSTLLQFILPLRHTQSSSVPVEMVHRPPATFHQGQTESHLGSDLTTPSQVVAVLAETAVQGIRGLVSLVVPVVVVRIIIARRVALERPGRETRGEAVHPTARAVVVAVLVQLVLPVRATLVARVALERQIA